MEGAGLNDDNWTSALIDEVFNEVDSPTETPCKSTTLSQKNSSIDDEYDADISILLGCTEIKRKTPEKNGGFGLFGEDGNSFNDVKKASSTTTPKSKIEKGSKDFSNATPKNGKNKTDLKSIQEKLNKYINKTETPLGDNNKQMVDPLFGMRIINPTMSSQSMLTGTQKQKVVPLSQIRTFLIQHKKEEISWLTGGAIVGKICKVSQNGNHYGVWTLTDLKGDIKCISVFLFGNVYQQHKTIPLGSVVAVINGAVLENKNKKIEATLKVYLSDSVMVLGKSMDYGTCKSKKANGEDCTAVVNKSACEYCTYHVKQAYNKTRRPELQANFTGSGLINLKNKVLGKNEVFYGGRSFTAVKKTPATAQSRERERARMLPQPAMDKTKFLKDQELLKRLSGETKPKPKTVNETPTADNSNITQHSAISDINKPKKEKIIDLNSPITSRQILRAKANAMWYVKRNGPIKKPDDDIRKKRTPEQVMAIKRKLETEENDRKKMKMNENKSPESPKSAAKLKKEKSGITERFLELMNAKPENAELLKEGESEEREKYFNKLEIREKMEEKMATTYKVDCKAVRCLKCNYKSFSASELCKKEKHPLKVVGAVKRFWKCRDCSARTVSLDLLPIHSCKVCSGSRWEKASMLPEKKAQPLASERLSIRGHEETFIGSVVQNPNINLLVPDEGC